MGFFDWFNGLLSNTTTAFQGAVVLVAAIIGFVVMAKAKFAFTTVIIAGLAAGMAIALAIFGGNWISGMIKHETVNAASASASVVLVHETAPTGDYDLAD
jgi:hypothetical protein